MDTNMIEQISEVPSAKPLSESRVKNSKKIALTTKMCTYFKDMECRLPLCDMEICQKCPDGGIYCVRVNILKNLVQRVLLVFLALLFITEGL